jgi:hypothetical protein
VNPGQWAYYHIFNKPPGARTVLPIGQSILAGLIVFAFILGIASGFAHISHSAGMGALVVLGLMGLSFGYRSGMLAVLGATFVTLLPGAMAVQGVDDYRQAKRLRWAEMRVADLPATPPNAIYVLKDFRVASEFAHVSSTQRTVGGKAETVHWGAVPIVSPHWKKGDAVRAWLVCTGDEAWCATVLSHPVRAVQRAEPRDYRSFRAAVEAAVQRHGLAAAPEPFAVSHTVAPDERAGGAMTGIIVMPILGFIVWLIGFLIWRAIRPARAVAPVRAKT